MTSLERKNCGAEILTDETVISRCGNFKDILLPLQELKKLKNCRGN